MTEFSTKANIVYFRNQDFQTTLQLTEANDDAIDITGYDFRLCVSDVKGDDPEDYEFDIEGGDIEIVSASEGQFSVTIPTNAVPAGNWFYDLVAIDPAGDIKSRWYGTFTSREGVTQPIAMMNSDLLTVSAIKLDFQKMAAKVRDLTTLANGFYGEPLDLLTNTSPPTKYLRNRRGLLESGSNLRCDYDPVTHEPLGLLIESAETNLIANSETVGTKVNLNDTSNAVRAPTGAVIAYRITETTATDYHFEYDEVTMSGPGQHAGALYIYKGVGKADYESSVRVDLQNATDGVMAFVIFNPADGTVSVGSQYILEDHGDWWRVHLQAVSTVAATRLRVFLGSGASYAGDGVTWISCFGKMFVEGAYKCGSYIRTTGSPATRAKDQISLPTTAFDYRQNAGCFLVGWHIHKRSSGSFSRLFGARYDDSNSIRARVEASSGIHAYEIQTAGVYWVWQPFIVGADLYAGNRHLCAFRVADNASGYSLDGATSVVDTNCAMPTGKPAALELGMVNTIQQLDGYLTLFAYSYNAYDFLVLEAESGQAGYT